MLDLNGYTMSGSVSNGLLINSGTLQITDSTANVEEKIHGTLKKYNDNDEYYFKEENGIIVSNYEENDGAQKPAGYIEIDLTKRNEEDRYKLEMTVSGAMYINATETEEKPEQSAQMAVNGTNKDHSIELTGGKKYYIHIKQNNSVSYLSDIKLKQRAPGSDTEFINTIAIMDNLITTKGIIDYNIARATTCINNTETGTLNIDSVKIGTEATQEYYQKRIVNSGKLTIENSVIIGDGYTTNEAENQNEVKIQ